MNPKGALPLGFSKCPLFAERKGSFLARRENLLPDIYKNFRHYAPNVTIPVKYRKLFEPHFPHLFVSVLSPIHLMESES